MQTPANAARNILAQLGGARFAAMTGATALIDLGNGLQFRIGRGARDRINSVRVVLTSSDLYSVAFYRIGRRGLDVTEVGSADAVFAEDLRSVFTAHTGLDCTL